MDRPGECLTRSRKWQLGQGMLGFYNGFFADFWALLVAFLPIFVSFFGFLKLGALYLLLPRFFALIVVWCSGYVSVCFSDLVVLKAFLMCSVVVVFCWGFKCFIMDISQEIQGISL